MDNTLSLDYQQTDFGREFAEEVERLDGRIDDEIEARSDADDNLQSQIDTIKASSDVVDIVGTYAELEEYDTSKLNDNDIVKVLEDETHDGDITYYRWSTSTEAFSFVGSLSAYYSKGETDTLLSGKQDTLTAGTNIQINDNVISATDTTYSDFTGTDGTAAGAAGLVPAPATTDAGKYLKADGTWATISVPTVTLYCYWGDASDTFTPYYDAAHTQAVSYFDFIQLVRTKNVTLMWDDHDGLNYTQTIIASFIDSYDPTDPQNPPSSINFIAAKSGYLVEENNLIEYTWNSGDSRFSSLGNQLIPRQKVWYATSSTSGSTSSKVATTTDYVYNRGFSLEAGNIVFVKFYNQSTSADNLYLNVDNTGSKQVYVTGNYADGSYLWNANDVVGFIYDGTYWRMLGGGKATTSSYGKVKLATNYTDSSSTTVPTSAHLYSVYSMLSGKQNQLTAGTGISIDANNVISATGGVANNISSADWSALWQ